MAGQQSVEFQVTLGLQGATLQVEVLRKMLLESVKMDSSAFKDIERFLNKISGQADSLKGKMGEAFKTSKGSTLFLKLYEDLLNMLEAAKGKFTSLGLKDIAFSPDDQGKIDGYIGKILQLLTEILGLSQGKVGNIFDDSSIASAELISNFIKNMPGDVSKLTFSGLSLAIGKELATVELSFNSAKEKAQLLLELVNNLSGSKLADLTSKMLLAVEGSVDKSKSSFKTENLMEYRLMLDDFYKGNLLGAERVSQPLGNVGKVLDLEASNIAAAADKIKENIRKCDEAFAELKKIREDPSLTGAKADAKINDVATTLGITDFDASKFTNYTSAIKNLRERMQEELMHGFKDEGLVQTYADELIKNLSNVFNNADLNKVINVGGLKDSLKLIFKDVGVDLKDSDITKIFDSINKNMDTSDFMRGAINSLEEYKLKLEEARQATQLTADESAAKMEELTQMLNSVNATSGAGKDASIELKKSEILLLIDLLNDYVNAANKANAAKLTPGGNGGDMNKAKTALELYILSLLKLESKQKTLGNVQMAINRWMGFYLVLNLTKRAINDMKKHIQELDTVMTQIAVVTNMSQELLWGQIGQYSLVARQYGVAIKGVYEVSLIYYQLGLESNDVMTLTTETLKMARIAGLDYSTAADYMTTAIRGFKMEMTDAAHVTDVFSALAANTASSTEELATAISKTAASAANVGSSFEATSAMMATMIATTRESATNIGTALKSIISRYGEMKENPEGKDSEGEEYSLNKVDKALLTIGVSIHTAAGEFRDFDEVILELAEKWDTLDSVSLRYIATIMAGNRQQSRFLALVSNVDEYKRALEVANESEGTGDVLMLKTLDSVDAKLERMRVTILEFYTSSGLELLYKNVIDTITNIIGAANKLPKVFGKIPALAIAIGASLVSAFKSVLILIINSISAGLLLIKGEHGTFLLGLVTMWTRTGAECLQGFNLGANANAPSPTNNPGTTPLWYDRSGVRLGARYAGAALSLAGSAMTLSSLNQYGASTSLLLDTAAGWTGIGGAASSILGSAATGFATAGPWGALAGAAMGLVTLVPSLLSSILMLNGNIVREVELATKEAEQKKNEATEKLAEYKGLDNAHEKLLRLEEESYKSAEAMQEYRDYMNLLADTYPLLISSMEDTGDYNILLTDLEDALADARRASAEATANATEAELKRQEKIRTGFLNTQSHIDNVASLTPQQEGHSAAYAQRMRENGITSIFEDDNVKLSYLSWLTGEDEIIDSNDTNLITQKMIEAYNQAHGEELQIEFSINELTGAVTYDTSRNEDIIGFVSLVIPLLEDLNGGSWLYTFLEDEVNTLKGIDPSLTTQYLVGQPDINSLTGAQAYRALDILGSRARELELRYDKTIETTGKVWARDQSDFYLSLLGEDANGFVAADHSKLIGNIVASNPDFLNLSEAERKKALPNLLSETNALAGYFSANLHVLEFLENDLNLDTITNEDELITLLLDLIPDIDGDIDDKVRKYYVDKFNAKMLTAGKAYKTAVNKYLVDEEGNLLTGDAYDKIAGLGAEITESGDFDTSDEVILNSSLLKHVLSSLPKYKLMAKETPIAAENYLNSLANTFSVIAGLSSEELEALVPIMTEVDFTDRESILKAIDALNEMDGDYSEVIDELETALKNLVINVKALALTILLGLGDYAKSVTKLFSNYGKKMSYGDALELALLLIESDSTLKLDQLIQETEDGLWILTDTAFKAQLKLTTAALKGQISALREEKERLQGYYKTIYGAKDYSVFTDETYDPNTGLFYSSDDIDYDEMMSYFETNYTGNDKEAGMAALERAYKEWNQLDDETKGSFIDYLRNEATAMDDATALLFELEERIELTVAESQLNAFDYKGLVSGKGNKYSKGNLRTLIESAIGSENLLDEDLFNEAYAKLISGDIDAWNNYINDLNEKTGSKIGQVDKEGALRERFTALNSLYKKLSSGEVVWSALSELEQLLLSSVNEAAGVDSTNITNAADRVWQAMMLLYGAGAFSMDEVAQDIEDRALDAFDATRLGKLKKLLDKYKDGFTVPELRELGLWDNEANSLKAGLNGYLVLDENGNYVAAAGQSAASVLKFLALQMGFAIDTTTDAYKKTIQEATLDEIADLEANDEDLQFLNILSEISSGKEGLHINIAGISSTAKKRLKRAGYDITGNILTIGTELAMNAAALAMLDLIDSDDWFWGKNKKSASTVNELTRKLKETKAKKSAFEGIIGQTVNKSAALAISLALENTQKWEDVLGIMEELGFKWNEAALVWEATSESITLVLAELLLALANGEISIEEYNNLMATLADTEHAISLTTKKSSAVSDIYANASGVTETMIANFRTAFADNISKYMQRTGEEIDWNKIFVKNDNGTYDIDFDEFYNLVNGEFGFALNDTIRQSLYTTVDNYTDMLDKAVSYVNKGTDSWVEMLAFAESFKLATGKDLDVNTLFGYDSEKKKWTLAGGYLFEYAEAMANQLGLVDEAFDEYILLNVYNRLKEDIDLSHFIDPKRTKKDEDDLRRLLTEYEGALRKQELIDLRAALELRRLKILQTGVDSAAFTAFTPAEAGLSGLKMGKRSSVERLDSEIDDLTETIEDFNAETDDAVAEMVALKMAALEAGGEEAVRIAQELSTEPLTLEEVEKFYKAGFNRYLSIFDAIGSGVGTVVSSSTADLLETAEGIELTRLPDGSAVITAVTDMVAAYGKIYNLMASSAGATTTELNAAYAKILNALDLLNVDVIDALLNALGMTYEALGEMLARYGITLEEAMLNPAAFGLERTGFGKVKIASFEEFAKKIFNVDNLEAIKDTDEYLSAYKAYNDGLISMNKSAELAITEEIKALESAKGGDWLNLTTLWSKLEDAASDAVEFSFEGYNGNVRNLGNRKIIPDELMDKYFGPGEGWGTINGVTFSAADFLHGAENVVATFALMTEAGEIVEDIDTYVNSLYELAWKLFGSTDPKYIKALDLAQKRLLLDIQEYEGFTREEALAAGTARALKLHEAEEKAYTPLEIINASLEMYGAKIEDGILKLSDGANLLGVASTLALAAETAGLEIGNGLELIQDTIVNILNAYREAISKGISGGLSSEEKQGLILKASDMGITNLDFTETKEGFKLTTKSAKELYFALNRINLFLGDLLFKDIKDTLIATDDRYATILTTNTEIKRLAAEIRELRSQPESPLNDARIAALEEELALAEKINMVRSVDAEDDSFKFMEGKIPEGQNNPLNYWKNWASAFDAMRTAGLQKGKAKNTIAYEDFYNIATEMGRLAELSGKYVTLGDTTLRNSLDAANLITKAAGALKNVGGEMKVDLSKMNIDFSSGLQGLGEQVDALVDALADELIHMLDSLIGLLEVIVAFEELEDIDVNKDLVLDFDELGIEIDNEGNITAITGDLLGAVDKLLLLEATFEDGTNVLDALTITTGKATVSFREFLTNWHDIDWLNRNGITGAMYRDIFSNFFNLSKRDDYKDKSGTAEGFMEMLLGYTWDNMTLSINSGDHVLTVSDAGVYHIDWANVDYDSVASSLGDALRDAPKDKNGRNAKILEMALQALNDINAGNETKVENNQVLKVVLGQVKVVKSKKNGEPDKYYANGHEYDSLEQATLASDLLSAGVEHTNIKFAEDVKSAEGEITIGNAKMKVKTRGGGARFITDDGKEFSSQLQAIDHEFLSAKGLLDENGRLKDSTYTLNRDSAEYQEWMIELGYRVTPIYKITGKDGKDKLGDPTKDPALKSDIEEFLGKGQKNIKYDLSKSGKAFIVTLPSGAKVEIPKNGLEFNNEAEARAYIELELLKSIGLDESLSANITKGITDAFALLPKILEGLDSEPVDTLATSLSTAATSASTLYENLVKVALILGLLPSGPNGLNLPLNENNNNLNGSSDNGTNTSVNADTSEAQENVDNLTDSINNIPDSTLTDITVNSEDAQINLTDLLLILNDICNTELNLIISQDETTTTTISNMERLSELITQIVGEDGTERKFIINGDVGSAKDDLESMGNNMDKIVSKDAIITVTLSADTGAINSAASAVNSFPEVDKSSSTTVTHTTVHETIYRTKHESDLATGNFARATGNISGTALASGTKTLMGELGPELVVSNGLYFIAGQEGAEFVDLNSDAIVFNHLLTRLLLKNGMSPGRGRAVTNEHTAIAFAGGNVEGPALASARSALAALKQLRAMWQSLKAAKVSDLAGAGGGGGGGGGGDKNKIVDPKTWIATVERWYNLTLEIAKLEKEITHEETLREKILSSFLKNGKAYFASQKQSLEALLAQVAAQEELNLSRREYYDRRVEALKKSPLGSLYTFDDEGQLKFNKETKLNGKDGGMLFLTDLMGFDENKGANYTNKEKYEILMANGFGDYMKFDSNGQKIIKDSDHDGTVSDEELETFYEQATQAWKDKIDSYAEETQTLWDSIQDGEKELLELQADMNEIWEEMRENLTKVEDAVLKAIEDMKQREIDALLDEREALEESVNKYIDGLTDALNKELEMYEDLDSQDELNRKKRRLGILQRTGASASEIASLLSEIDESERDAYFDMLQQLIDAILEASNKQIERLDSQIDLMNLLLEYLKEYGLLWYDVYEVMHSSAELIASFITNNNSEFWKNSPLSSAEKFNETLFQALQWKSYEENIDSITGFATMSIKQMKDLDYEKYNKAMKSEYGEDYDKEGKYKDIFNQVWDETNDLTKASEAARKAYVADKDEKDRRANAEKYKVPYEGTGEWAYTKYNLDQHYAHHYKLNSDGVWIYQSTKKESHDWKNKTCTKCGEKKVDPAPASSSGGGGGGNLNSGICTNCLSTCFLSCARACRGLSGSDGTSGGLGSAASNCKVNCIGACKSTCSGVNNKRARGGYVGHGLYELGEQGTETVLTAQLTQILRNNILSNRPNSLISLLKTYNEGFSRMETPLTGETSTDNSTNIENVSINMNVQQISNDYDARRAGEQAMNEIMRIARKTSAANSIRR